jgi:hypothetical protein
MSLTLQLNKAVSDLWVWYVGVFVRTDGPWFEAMTPVYGRIYKVWRALFRNSDSSIWACVLGQMGLVLKQRLQHMGVFLSTYVPSFETITPVMSIFVKTDEPYWNNDSSIRAYL